MEWLFFLIFGGIMIFFAYLGFKFYKEYKKIIDAYKNKTNGRVLDRSDLQEEEVCVFYSEQPFFDSYKEFN
jgi:hypothetical protein